ncbi:hypothetical protein [Rhizobium sp. LC145]|jgi:hypothetical protein|uniref:hypothetical protein n=1 Tax=Rhizobium sp. LC145 TaxID=1120688 RepID=UPI000629E761|nr:hypothetical protein [Rhizobium sp. LC145]KKX25093.1 hypothetical protein YH62_26540 [Rhizobium sp. LC145]TKT55053.1 hypothetical protein FDR95_19235 [Rhizobiaceae bacterium LC148]
MAVLKRFRLANIGSAEVGELVKVIHQSGTDLLIVYRNDGGDSYGVVLHSTSETETLPYVDYYEPGLPSLNYGKDWILDVDDDHGVSSLRSLRGGILVSRDGDFLMVGGKAKDSAYFDLNSHSFTQSVPGGYCMPRWRLWLSRAHMDSAHGLPLIDFEAKPAQPR